MTHPLPLLPAAIGVAVLYFVLGHASFLMTASSAIVTPVFFAPEAVALAASLLLGPRVWPGVFIGQFALAVSRGLGWEPALLISAINSMEAVIGVLLIRRWGVNPAMERTRDLGLLLFSIFFILQPFSATLGTLTLLRFGVIPDWPHYAGAWLDWWQGNVMAQSLLTPMLLVAFSAPGRFLRGLRQAWIPLLLLVPAGWIAFGGIAPWGMAVALVVYVPLFLWIADRAGIAVVCLASSSVALLALYVTRLGGGPFVMDGALHILDLNVFVLGLAVTAQFFSLQAYERRALGKEKDEIQERLRGLFELSPLGIALNDMRGRFVDFNESFRHITGYPAEELMSLDYWTLTPRRYEQEEMRQLESLASTGRYGPYEKEYLRKDGRLVPLNLNGMLVTGANGERYIWSIVEDISERKRIDRLKDEFVSTVSHELRTPLTSISGSLGLLASGVLGPLPEQGKNMVDMALRNSNRLTHLINDLLDMEKIVAGKMRFDSRAQPLMPLVEESLDANRSYAEQCKVTYRLTGRADDIEVQVDPQRLVQILANFLSNAAKFSPEGGVVEVSVQRRDGVARVIVRDHGPGVPEDFRERIFHKFSQADSSDTRQKGGTGLGLAITKALAEHMGGRVGFDSVEGGGAAFYVELPIVGHAPNGQESDERTGLA